MRPGRFVRSLGGLGPLGGVCERVVEGIQRVAAVDDEFEALSRARVLDRDGQRVVTRVPEEQNVHAVALAGSQLSTRAR
jgi:hypothetical protein